MLPRHQRQVLVVALWGAILLMLAGAPAASAVASASPAIAAPNAVVIADYPGGQRVIFDRAMHAHVPPASLTKVMTALVALDTALWPSRLRPNLKTWLAKRAWACTLARHSHCKRCCMVCCCHRATTRQWRSRAASARSLAMPAGT